MDFRNQVEQDLVLLSQTRKNLLAVMEPLTLAQINHIPSKLNNNIIWNAGHCWVTQVLLTEGLAGLPHGLSSEFVAAYRKGSVPSGETTSDERAYIEQGLRESPDQLAELLDNADWSNYRPYTTSYGATMSNIVEGVRFNNVHEGMHLGVMLAQARLV